MPMTAPNDAPTFESQASLWRTLYVEDAPPVDGPAGATPASIPPGAEASLKEEGEEKAAEVFQWAPGERDRLALFPIRHPDIWAYRKKIEALHWTAQEVDISADKKDWETRMGPAERGFITTHLSYFARADADVLAAIGDSLGKIADCLEAKMVYSAQEDQECVHMESYALQIQAVLSGDEAERALNAVRHMPAVCQLREWVLKWTSSAVSHGERLIAFAAIEGVTFSASFCALQWLRGQNLLPGVTDYNTFISRDEAIHTAFTCLLVRKYLTTRPPAERAYEIFREAVAAVDILVNSSLPTALHNMNAPLMRQYVRFQADCVLADLGYARYYGVPNPFPEMDNLALNETTKTSFFERGALQYQGVVSPEDSALRFESPLAAEDLD